MSQLTTLIAVLVSCLAVVYGQGNRCVEGLFDEVVSCFSAQGLDLNVEPGQQDATQLMREAQAMDPSVQCRNKEVYKNAVSCSLTALQKCLSDLGMGGAIPDPDKFRQGLDVVCDKLQDFDSQCMKSKYNDILSCGEETVKYVVQETDKSDMTLNDIICLSADVNYDCATKYLQSCQKQTMNIYLEQLDKYQVPMACANRSPGRSGRPSYTASTGSNSVSASFTLFAAVVSLASYLSLNP